MLTHPMTTQDTHHVSSVSSQIEARPSTAPSLESYLASAAVRRLAPREHIFCEGDRRSHVYKVESGALALYRVMTDGRRQVISFAYPGDLVGLGTSGEHSVSAQATTGTRLRCLSLSSLHENARHDARLGLKLYEALSDAYQSACDLILTVGQRDATERLAAFLLALSRRNVRRGEDGRMVRLPMTRSDIGDFLGLTIETVSRSFTKLKTAHVIRLVETSLVEIRDPATLERLAEGTEHE
jgi:CRP/FNR family transcriptional regulator